MRASECVAIAIDTTTGDLALRDGAPYLVSGTAAVRVLAWAAVRCQRDDFFDDLQNPTDLPMHPSASVAVADAWFGGLGIELGQIEVQYRRTLRAIPGVSEVRALRLSRQPGRGLLVEATLVAAFDDQNPSEVVISG